VLTYARKIWQRRRELLPARGFYFDRPLVVLQSDDWGRVGLRDQEGFDQLRAGGLDLGANPYDLYTLETAEDLAALRAVLNRHRDASGRAACIVMNFIVANLDFAKMRAEQFQQIHLLPLDQGVPENWRRPGLLEAYHDGIAEGTFYPALHGVTHFCRAAVERHLEKSEDRRALLQTLWQAETPYIYWRMPWIGFEYWDPEQPRDEQFLDAERQQKLIGQAVGLFTRFFSMLPRSACAPGYRANKDTHHSWARHGIHTAQSGPGAYTPPQMGRYGLLHLFRTIEFEPATDRKFSLEFCVRRARECFQRGVPAIFSVHSINFHSSVRDFRTSTLKYLDELLSALESSHPDLLYLHDEDLYQLVKKESYEAASGPVHVQVTKKTFIPAWTSREKR
jgi:hypothetical protein